jgi:hypothetical protein
MILKSFALPVAVVCLAACGSAPSSKDFNLSYQLARQYTGQTTNALTIDLIDDGEDSYTFSLNSELADVSIEEGAEYALESQTLNFSYSAEGVYSADFKVNRGNGTPFIYEILTWEYSLERPPEPIVSFASTATRSTVAQLLVSDSRPTNVTDIWLSGDISISGKSEIEDEGYWEPLDADTKAELVTLSPGDGVKRVDAKLRNVFGNVGELGVPAEIILKQTAPTDCDAVPISTTIGDTKVSLKMSATDPYQVYYSVFGDVQAVVNETPFDDGDVVFVYVEASAGAKTISVSITDIAGNNCFQKDININVDPSFESEGIFVQDHVYWTDTENVTLDVLFEYFPDQDPLQLKITGDIFGDKTHSWIPYQTDIPVTLNPSTSGNRRIYAQYKDAQGQESYLLSKRIFLKPQITLQDAGAPFKDVIVSNILDAPKLTINGCNETYDEVVWAASYTCEPNAATVDVVWHLKDGSDLTRSATP